LISPCISHCKLSKESEKDRYCVGCFRSLDELRNWRAMTDSERESVMNELPMRMEAMSYEYSKEN
jgi:predicted Fe-S protein YdhL (DUF1289 family)